MCESYGGKQIREEGEEVLWVGVLLFYVGWSEKACWRRWRKTRRKQGGKPFKCEGKSTLSSGNHKCKSPGAGLCRGVPGAARSPMRLELSEQGNREMGRTEGVCRPMWQLWLWMRWVWCQVLSRGVTWTKDPGIRGCLGENWWSGDESGCRETSGSYALIQAAQCWDVGQILNAMKANTENLPVRTKHCERLPWINWFNSHKNLVRLLISLFPFLQTI